MGRVRRAQISAQENAELWTRWKRGESPTDIGRALARDRSAVRYVVAGKVPYGWSAVGDFVSYAELPESGLLLLPMSGDRQPTSYLRTAFAEAEGIPSPDGRWMAYRSDESGEDRVYVRRVPPSDGQWLISTSQGSFPRWKADGRELYYVTDGTQLMAVDIDAAGDAPIIGIPRPLFQVPFRQTPAPRNVFDVTPDGQRFLVNTVVEGAGAAPITWVLNWTAELEP